MTNDEEVKTGQILAKEKDCTAADINLSLPNEKATQSSFAMKLICESCKLVNRNRYTILLFTLKHNKGAFDSLLLNLLSLLILLKNTFDLHLLSLLRMFLLPIAECLEES